MDFDVLVGQSIGVSIELDAPWERRNRSVLVLMAVDVGEADVVRKSAEIVEDAKLHVVVGKFCSIGLEGGVFDAGAQSFDQGFTVSNPFYL